MYVIDIYMFTPSSSPLWYSGTRDRVTRLFGVSSVLVSFPSDNQIPPAQECLCQCLVKVRILSSSVYSLFNVTQHILVSRLAIHRWMDTLLGPGRCHPSREMFITAYVDNNEREAGDGYGIS